MATWPHISAKNTTDVLQEGLPTGSEGGLYIAGFTKHRSQREPHSPGKNVMCRRWDTPAIRLQRGSTTNGISASFPQFFLNTKHDNPGWGNFCHPIDVNYRAKSF